MFRSAALLVVCALLLTACGGRAASHVQSGIVPAPGVDGAVRSHVARTSKANDPAHTSQKDVQHLYTTYRRSGGLVRLHVSAVQQGAALDEKQVRQALDKDFDALYLLLKAAPESVLRIQAQAPQGAEALARNVAHELQESCNLSSQRLRFDGKDRLGREAELSITVASPRALAVVEDDAPVFNSLARRETRVLASANVSALSQETASASPLRPAVGPEVRTPVAPLSSPAVKPVFASESGDMLTLRFPSGRTVLEPGMHGDVARIAARLQGNPNIHVILEGHSDNVGGAENNELLSYQRALAVQIALIKDHGVAPERLEVRGLGEAFPVADNASLGGRSLNRRVEVRFIRSEATGRTMAQPRSVDLRTQTPIVASPAVTTEMANMAPTPVVKRGVVRSVGQSRIAEARQNASAPGATALNVRFGSPAARGHFVATSLRPYASSSTQTAIRAANVRYEPLSQTPRKFHIEISVSKCTLWLYEVLSDGSKRLVRPFQVATAKPGTAWPRGEGRITGIDYSPWWYPTENMVRRARKLGKRLVPVPPGASHNPMGAVKIMLSHVNNGGAYRIHGTNQPWLIGRRVSLGCIRMRNEDSLELARLAPVGTVVDIQY